MNLKSIFPILLLTPSLYAQPQLEKYEDGVYREYIRSVRFHVNGLALTYPIATLGTMESLFLSFDELEGHGTRYTYTVIHCDRNWQPTSELSPFDYLGSFREGEIRDYEVSSGTYQHYLHYFLALPNDELKWTISGNYILVVYEAGYDDDPILTRRFMVTEEKVRAIPSIQRPANVAKQNTHQEIDFSLDIQALSSPNPRMEITCTLLQNGRWDTRMDNITPRTITGTLLDYNYQDKIVFEAGKEFRNMDISSMIYRSENVLDIKEYAEGFSTVLFPDDPRARQAYLWRRDLNGMFVPFNRDYFRKRVPLDSLASTLNLVNRYNYREQQLSTEYTEVIITLKTSDDNHRDVYVVGGMTDWKMLPEYRLTYDERVGGYAGRLYLKQGYYNYAYAIPDPSGNPDFSYWEGNWFATENQYILLTYFRPRGGQYDQLVGALTFTSNE